MVDTDADGSVVLFADIDKGHELGLNLLQFLLIFLVSVLQMLKSAARVNVVARVNSHLLTVLCGNVGGVGCEMDVGHQGLVITVLLQTG